MNIRVLALLSLALAASVPGAAAPEAATSKAGEERIETLQENKGSKELVYRDDVLTGERRFDERGALVEERSFDAKSLPVETKVYMRKDGRLTRVEAKDSSGELSGSMAYHYDSSGRLLGVSSEGSMGQGAAGVIAAGSSPQGSWTADSATMVQGYDDEGRVVLSQTMKDGMAISVERRSYSESGKLASVRTEDRTAGSSRETSYDEKGRPASRVDTPAKGLVEKTEYRYGDTDLPITEVRVKGTHKTIIAKSYDDEGVLAREETRLDGELVLSVDYDGIARVEELYEDGQPFVRASYEGGRKVKDEFFSDGSVVRTRDYQ
jgi:antitoxin component YwqK of YwqJK toxin-antitoxin module